MQLRFLLALLFIPCAIYSQIKIRNTTLINPDTNILYIGIDNKIEILGLKSYAGLSLYLYDDPIDVDANGKAIVRVSTVGEHILQIKNSKRVITSKKIDVQLIKAQKVSLGPYSDTALSFNQIKHNNLIHAYHPGCIAKLRLDMLSFVLEIKDIDNEITGSYDIPNNKIPDEILEIIKNLRSGSRLLFTRFRVIGADDAKYPSFNIYIK